jgi:hypothetical protein
MDGVSRVIVVLAELVEGVVDPSVGDSPHPGRGLLLYLQSIRA